MFIYGCPPTNTVPGVSQLSVLIKNEIEKNVERNGVFTNFDPQELRKKN
jgi:hypothetical protein